MGNYSIKDLEILTGIKAHTIRIWEQRYDILEPERSTTNIRTYTDEDLKHLLNVALLNRNGYKISKVSKMPEKEISSLILKITENSSDYQNQIDTLILAMVNFDEEKFEKVLTSAVSKFGFEETFINVVFPFLFKIGVLWQTSMVSPSQEHFITNLIRQKIIVAIDNQVLVPNDSIKKFLLYLPEKEMHELSLLFLNYLLRQRNNKTIYLGGHVPMADVHTTVEEYNPDYVFSVFTSFPNDDNVIPYLQQFRKRMPDTNLIIFGRQADKVGDKLLDKKMRYIKTFDESLEFLSQFNNHQKLNNSTFSEGGRSGNTFYVHPNMGVE